MTANAGYKTFNTGDVLTAAQVQYNLQNQTVMYFATTTARDAALTGSILVEGMVSYVPSTGIRYYNGSAWVAPGTASPLTTKGDVWGYSTTDARIPVGTNNQVLTADSTTALGVKWASPTSGSITLLSTTTLSGTSTTISSIPQTYTNLFAVISAATLNTAFTINVQANGSTSSSQTIYVSSGTTPTLSDTAGLLSNNGNRSTGPWYGYVYINNYASTTMQKTGSSEIFASTAAYGFGSYFYTANTAITSLVFTPNNASFSFTGGSVLLYGVN